MFPLGNWRLPLILLRLPSMQQQHRRMRLNNWKEKILSLARSHDLGALSLSLSLITAAPPLAGGGGGGGSPALSRRSCSQHHAERWRHGEGSHDVQVFTSSLALIKLEVSQPGSGSGSGLESGSGSGSQQQPLRLNS